MHWLRAGPWPARRRMGSPNRSRHRLPCDPRQPQNPSNIHPLTFANPAPQKSTIAPRRPEKLRTFAFFGPKVPKTRPLHKVANCTTRRPKQDTARTCPSASPHHFQKKKRFPPVMEMSQFFARWVYEKYFRQNPCAARTKSHNFMSQFFAGWVYEKYFRQNPCPARAKTHNFMSPRVFHDPEFLGSGFF